MKANLSSGALYRVAIVGAATLRGRDLKEVLEEKNFPAKDIVLLDDEESLGQLENIGEEATFIQSATRADYSDYDVVFFASDEEFTKKHWQRAQEAGCAIVDLSYALETEAGVSVTSPWLQGTSVDLKNTAVTIAHPAATTLALLLSRATRVSGLKGVVVNLFDPVSERGRRGMDELHQQTLNLLSFQPMPKEVFDVQVAFNIVPRYGGEAKQTVEASELRVLRHMRMIAPEAPLPALQVLQAPTFHGHTMSILLEFEKRVSIVDVNAALAGDHVTILGGGDEPPSNVNIAGEETIHVWAREDTTREGAIWLWAAADNLRLSALAAYEAGLAVSASRPSGKVQ
jgi:aspartate-semialdehyde dehydrogenase